MVLGDERVRKLRQDVVPERQHRPAALHHPGRPRQHPEVEVLAPVAPPREVRAGDSGNLFHRSAQSLQERPERQQDLRRRVLEPVVLVGGQPTDERDPDRREAGLQMPVLVPPEQVVARSAVPALRAIELARAWLLRHEHRLEPLQRHCLEARHRVVHQRVARHLLSDRQQIVVGRVCRLAPIPLLRHSRRIRLPRRL